MTIERRILLNPGPATTTDSVKKAQVVADICPREREFVDVMAEVRRELLRALGNDTDYTCVLFGGSGTAGVEATMVSAVPPTGKVLIINNGAYGQRMVDIANAHGIAFCEFRNPWDKKLDIDGVERQLKLDKAITHIAVVHHETSTGMLNPLERICELAEKYHCSMIVDAISSFAGIRLPVDRSSLDYIVSTSNKCVQGMAGVTFIFCRKSALEKIESHKPRAYYLDLVAQHRFFEATGEMRFTPPVQVIYALRQALKELREEGVAGRCARYRDNWEVLNKGLSELGFRFLLPSELQAGIVTAVYEPEKPLLNFENLHDQLYSKGVTIYPGKIPGTKTFRIANMGAIDRRDIHFFLSELSKIL